MPINHSKIIYPLISVLFIASGFLLYQNEKLQMAAHGAANPLGPGVALAQNSSSTISDIIVGGGASGTIATNVVFGTITQVSTNLMKLKDQTTGGTDSVSITANTQVQLDGPLKDQATQQKDLAGYNAEVAMLMKDPVKNKAALAAMRIPLAQSVTPGKLADLAVGDYVMVAASSITSGNVFVASFISKSTAATPK